MLALNHRKDFTDVLSVKAEGFVLFLGLYIALFFFQRRLSEHRLKFDFTL